MTKIIGLANNCNECPNRRYYSAGTYECSKVSGADYLAADGAIPDWCPLPSYPVAPPVTVYPQGVMGIAPFGPGTASAKTNSDVLLMNAAPSASIADTAGAKLVAWLIDWPDEPDLGHYFSDDPVDPLYCRSTPLYGIKYIERLHKFLNAAGGEGLVLDGIDAGDLYAELFPERYKAAIAAPPAPSVADAAGASETRDQLYFALVGAESQLRQISKLMSEGHEFIDKGRTIEMWADMAKAAIAKESGND